MDEHTSPTPTRSLWTELALASTVLVVTASVAASSALLADRTLLSLVVLVAEPVVWFSLLSLTGLALSARHRRWALAACAIAGLVLTAALLRFPNPPAATPAPSDQVPRSIRRAVRGLDLPSGHVRVATWNARGAAASSVETSGFDVLVLADARSPSQEPPDGRILFAPSSHDLGLAIVVPQGRFASLGERGSWLRFGLPAGEAVFAVVQLPSGELPVLAVDLDTPRNPAEATGWATRLQDSAAEIASLAVSLGSPGLVLTGDTATHGTFRHFLRAVASAGIQPAPPRATWPATLGGLPAPPLYHADRTWFGRAWSLADLRTQRWGSDHLALVVELEPAGG